MSKDPDVFRFNIEKKAYLSIQARICKNIVIFKLLLSGNENK